MSIKRLLLAFCLAATGCVFYLVGFYIFLQTSDWKGTIFGTVAIGAGCAALYCDLKIPVENQKSEVGH
jgi:hypothetical protein